MVFLAPNIEPTAAGIRLKNAPHPSPFSTMNTDSTATELAKGQIASALTPAKSRDRMRLFSGPNTASARKPATTRPMVDATFHIARMMTATRCEATARAYIGIKYEGMNNGKQPSPLPTKRRMKARSLKRYLKGPSCYYIIIVFGSSSENIPLDLWHSFNRALWLPNHARCWHTNGP